jgi:hypothetical protein
MVARPSTSRLASTEAQVGLSSLLPARTEVRGGVARDLERRDDGGDEELRGVERWGTAAGEGTASRSETEREDTAVVDAVHLASSPLPIPPTRCRPRSAHGRWGSCAPPPPPPLARSFSSSVSLDRSLARSPCATRPAILSFLPGPLPLHRRRPRHPLEELAPVYLPATWASPFNSKGRTPPGRSALIHLRTRVSLFYYYRC